MHLRLRLDHKRRTALTVLIRPSRQGKDEERGRLTLEISGEKRYRLNAAPLASNSVRRQEYRRRRAFLTRFYRGFLGALTHFFRFRHYRIRAEAQGQPDATALRYLT